MPSILWLILLLVVPAAVAFLMGSAVLKVLGARPTWCGLFLISGVHAFLTLFTLVFLLGRLPGPIDENKVAYEFSASVRAFLNGADEGEGADMPQIITIDNSENKVLVPDPRSDPDDSLVLVLTDRAKLARLLAYLAEHQERVGQVVVDMTFEEPTAQDPALAQAVRQLVRYNKVVLAQGTAANCPTLAFNTTVMASVAAEQQGDRIAWYTLRRDGLNSLPYELYLRTTHRSAEPAGLGLIKESDGQGGRAYAYPSFTPVWDRLEADRSDRQLHAPVDASGLTMPLGYVLTEYGKAELLARLTPDPAGELPVVFIGEFASPMGPAGSDLHETILGRHHGSAILLDLFKEMRRGGHLLNGGLLFFQGLLFWVCSLLIFYSAGFPDRVRGDLGEGGTDAEEGVRRKAGWKRLCIPVTKPARVIKAPVKKSFNRRVWSATGRFLVHALPMVLFLVVTAVLHHVFGHGSDLVVIFIYYSMLLALFRRMDFSA